MDKIIHILFLVVTPFTIPISFYGKKLDLLYLPI
ncbi:hypothetical protein EZS27_000570 [termite gut metagenome]|uniref:Uncharacterized protein n=1 Tax=termite gut metagenome TaxID=433724 RepID=A0A5J4T1X7_9ZZZZ